MGIIDWLADKVQESTGEKERRQLVARAKELCIQFRQKVTATLAELNIQIQKFNEHIKELNAVRTSTVKENIQVLFQFLGKYGNCKASGSYVPEAGKVPAQFPEQEQARIEDYIKEIDWSNDEVFWNTFLCTPLGMKFKTRKQNLSMREQLQKLELEIEETIRELQIKKAGTELEQEICAIYIQNVRFISNFIQHKIIPEIELIDAFFQALYIKDKLICGQAVSAPAFSYPITALIGTPYEKHYQFIRNAFFFYILSCRIYDTPVLTNLLHHRSTQQDLQQATDEQRMLSQGAALVKEASSINRGK